jgi:hypothetical protein
MVTNISVGVNREPPATISRWHRHSSNQTKLLFSLFSQEIWIFFDVLLDFGWGCLKPSLRAFHHSFPIRKMALIGISREFNHTFENSKILLLFFRKVWKFQLLILCIFISWPVFIRLVFAWRKCLVCILCIGEILLLELIITAKFIINVWSKYLVIIKLLSDSFLITIVFKFKCLSFWFFDNVDQIRICIFKKGTFLAFTKC